MIGSRLWQIAGWTMLHYLWVGAALGAAALLARRQFRQAPAQVRYLLALGSLSLLSVAPAAVAVAVMQHVGAPASTYQELATYREPSPSEPASGADAVLPETMPLTVADDGVETPIAAAERLASAVPIAEDMPSLRAALELVVLCLPWLWICGTPLSFAVTTTGLLGAERLRRQSCPSNDLAISDLCRRLAASLQIARHVGVRICDRIAGPILVGILRPVILLPAALVGWDPRQLQIVLLHELAHVRRHDNLVNLVQRIVESLLFFQPMVWIVSAWVRQERECRCDELVVARTCQPRAYAEILVNLAERVSQTTPSNSRLAQSPAVSSFAQRPLVNRVRRILKKEEPTMEVSCKAVSLAFGAVLVVAMTIGGYCSLPTSADDLPSNTVQAEQEPAPKFTPPSGTPAEAGRKDAAATIEQIRQAWQARQDRIRSAKVDWKETRFIAKGTMPPAKLINRISAGEKGPFEPLPKTDVTFESTCSVWLSGDMSRVVYGGANWHPFRGRVEHNTRVFTFDGAVAKDLFGVEPGEETDGRPIGIIDSEERNHAVDDRDLMPVLMTCRPCDPDMGGRDLRRYKVKPGTESVNGRTCVVLTGTFQHAETLWLDVDRGFLVVKVTFGYDNTLDISYHDEPAFGWLPSEWKYDRVWRREGELPVRERVVGRMSAAAINPDIPRSEFQLQFPADATVSDLNDHGRRRKYSKYASLVEATKSPDAPVRRNAFEQTGQFGTERALDLLDRAVRDTDPTVRTTAVRGLSALSDPRAAEPLLIALKDPDTEIRYAAVTALEEFRDPRAVESLIVALTDTNSMVRSAAARALGNVPDARAVAPLEAATADENSFVRSHAGESLQIIRKALNERR